MSVTLEQLEKCQPLKPGGPRKQHENHAKRLLDRLRVAGAAGVTTGELIREGRYGLRPPNRIGTLRALGHEIETIPEANGVCRYRLIHEAEHPTKRPTRGKAAKQIPLSAQGGDWLPERKTGLELFDAAVRS
jgi:hypothetical protein